MSNSLPQNHFFNFILSRNFGKKKFRDNVLKFTIFQGSTVAGNWTVIILYLTLYYTEGLGINR